MAPGIWDCDNLSSPQACGGIKEIGPIADSLSMTVLSHFLGYQLFGPLPPAQSYT